MLKIFDRLLNSDERETKKLLPIVAKVNSLEAEMKKLKDEDFPAKTASFKERVSKGETLDDLLPEAFALIREAILRVIGQRAFDVQLMAAICLYQGRIAEQKTGEGKTLSAAVAAYLNGLSNLGVHVVTVNDYLARRDTGWYGKALDFAGLTLGCIIHEQSFLFDAEYEAPNQEDERLRHLRLVTRKEAYLADITYGTNNEYGFDYLRDNMAGSREDMVQRGHHFAIVDEVDSILIDEARTPLIISAPDTEPTEKYYEFAKLIRNLSADTDFVIDEKLKTANLTDHGIKKIEKWLGVENLYEKDFDTLHHIENALKARAHFLRDRDYVVKDGEVIIVDEFTGRLMFGRRWSDGLHQSVEAKEDVKIQQESITLATISFQNYFRMYNKLSGMTGTAATEAEEFSKIYNVDVVILPTNKPMVRTDKADLVYKTVRAKYDAVVSEIEDCYKRGQPVLVGTTSIEKNEIISKFLERRHVPHNVLNAKNHENEAKIIAEAGRIKTVTVATNMAGRGVDIVLGGSAGGQEHDEVVKLGGLHVIGTERHESRRIDNQLRGRAGRQGDSGSTRFFVSLEDDIMRLFGGEQVSRMMDMLKIPEDQPIEHGMVSKAIEQAQVKVEGFNFDQRKRIVEYDDVMNKQREIIYSKRYGLLTQSEGEGLKTEIQSKIAEEISNLVTMYAPEGFKEIEGEQIANNFAEILPLDDRSQEELEKKIKTLQDSGKITDFLTDIVNQAYEQIESKVTPTSMRELERIVYLRTIDHLWIDHLDAMDDLREGVGLRGYGHQDPLVEYKKEAYTSFERLMATIDHEAIRRIFRVQLSPQQAERPRVIRTNIDPKDGMGLKTPSANKIGRNDPCWCGSGKKFKKCHYPQAGS